MPFECLDVDLAYCLGLLSITPAQLQELIKRLVIALPQIQPLWIQMMRAGVPKPRGGLRSRFSSFLEDGGESLRKR